MPIFLYLKKYFKKILVVVEKVYTDIQYAQKTRSSTIYLINVKEKENIYIYIYISFPWTLGF